jgi:hypothetical protein
MERSGYSADAAVKRALLVLAHGVGRGCECQRFAAVVNRYRWWCRDLWRRGSLQWHAKTMDDMPFCAIVEVDIARRLMLNP